MQGIKKGRRKKNQAGTKEPFQNTSEIEGYSKHPWNRTGLPSNIPAFATRLVSN